MKKTQGVRSLHPGEEKAVVESHHCISVLKGWLQRGQRFSLHQETH